MELGLTDTEVASRVALSIDSYCDIEQHADEITACPLLGIDILKKICAVLKFDFFELFNMPCTFCEEGKQYLEDYSLPRNELICKRRMAMGISQKELADSIDYKEWAVQQLENTPDDLETWNIDDIRNLSNEINVPLQILLNVKCKKCGQ